MDLLIAGGGTGGHLFPGLALAEALRARQPRARVLFVGTARGLEAVAVPAAGFALATLPVSGLRAVGARARARGLLRLGPALRAARAVVAEFRPDVAVSVGGYAAGPAVLAARLAGVPCALMEQNAVAGLTNRLLAPLCRRAFVAMPTRGLWPTPVRILGNPTRAAFAAVRARPFAPASPPRLLVLGGSQGARALNDLMLALLPRLARWPLAPVVTLQAGRADWPRVQAAMATAARPGARAIAFIEDMPAALAGADLVLCRAGATTLAELTCCGRPAVLVPFPFAAGDHQTRNAHAMVAAGAADHLPQAEASVAVLEARLQALLAAPARLAAMAAAARAMGRPQAATDILDALAGEVMHVSR